MLIDVKQATIKTATVEIKTLTVSGKQVTLALFRQLEDEKCVDEEGRIIGNPWGRVNYHWRECSDLTEHLHVVWQKDDELRRAAIYRPQRPTLFELPEEGEQWICAASLGGWKPGRFPQWGDRWVTVGFSNANLRINIEAHNDDLRRVWSGSSTEARDRLAREVCHSYEEMTAIVEASLEQEINRISNYSASWQELRELPHLYIAV